MLVGKLFDIGFGRLSLTSSLSLSLSFRFFFVCLLCVKLKKLSTLELSVVVFRGCCLSLCVIFFWQEQEQSGPNARDSQLYDCPVHLSRFLFIINHTRICAAHPTLLLPARYLRSKTTVTTCSLIGRLSATMRCTRNAVYIPYRSSSSCIVAEGRHLQKF